MPDAAAHSVAPEGEVLALRPLRVLVASYRSHPQVGGQGVYVRELSHALAGLGHDVTVVSGPPYPELAPGVKLERLPSLDLFTHENGLLAFRPRMLGSWPDLAEWWLHNTGAFGEPYAFGERLAAWLAPRRCAFDVVHDNQGLFRTLPRLGLPAVATLHHPITVDLEIALAAEPRPAARALLRRWHGFLATQARVARELPAILTVSEASKVRAVLDFGIDPARLTVAHNGIDHDLFRVRPEVRREPALVVSTVSADTPLKGLAVLIEAMAKVAAFVPAAKLQIVGDLREGPAKRAIAAHGLEKSIIFSGRLSREQMAELYARATVVVTPSLFEGFGLPTAEAMACGAPVVVTDGGALPEVAGDAGLVVPAGEAEPLADAVGALLQDEKIRRDLGARGAARARASFSWRNHALAATALYLEAGAHADDRP